MYIESSNLFYRCILGSSQMVLYMAVFDLDLQGHFGLKLSKSAQKELVRTITLHAFELGSPDLHQICILGLSRTLLKMALIERDIQGHLGAITVEIVQNWLDPTITRHSIELGSPN